MGNLRAEAELMGRCKREIEKIRLESGKNQIGNNWELQEEEFVKICLKFKKKLKFISIFYYLFPKFFFVVFRLQLA